MTWWDKLEETSEGRLLLEEERVLLDVTETVARLLEEQGISRSELARRIGKQPAFVTKLLRGDNNFTLRTLVRVLDACGKTVHLQVRDRVEMRECDEYVAVDAGQIRVFDGHEWPHELRLGLSDEPQYALAA